MNQKCDNCGDPGRLTALDGFETLCASCEQAFADERVATVIEEADIRIVARDA